jgi:hypothetical protein
LAELEDTLKPQNRGSRSGRKRRRAIPAREKRKASAPTPPTRHHPLFGAIPLLRRASVDARGKEHEYWQYDPAYSPPLPSGAVRGDVSRQVYCPLCHSPKYFFVDEERSCLQCGEQFVFGAEEQKYWYETLRFYAGSVPVRCARCRRRRRSERLLREQIAAARAQIAHDARDGSAHRALARALVEYHERTESGNLDTAIAAARRAADLCPGSLEPQYWEAMAQMRAGRPRKARLAFESYLQGAGLERERAAFVKAAREFLARIS